VFQINQLNFIFPKVTYSQLLIKELCWKIWLRFYCLSISHRLHRLAQSFSISHKLHGLAQSLSIVLWLSVQSVAKKMKSSF